MEFMSKGAIPVVKDVIDFLTQQDPEVGNAVKAEYDRQRRNIELIASENFVSEAVLAAASTVLTNKYAEGYPGKRYYGGCECVDVVENIARDRAKKLFNANFVNVQAHSGASANFAVYQALCKLGDTVLADIRDAQSTLDDVSMDFVTYCSVLTETRRLSMFEYLFEATRTRFRNLRQKFE